MKFPTVNGANLNRQRLTLPADLQSELNVLFVPFWQWQQMEVNSWVPYIAQLEQKATGLSYYELPTIRKMNPISQWFINEGMRAGIPDPQTRAHTVTLYIQKNDFRRALEINDEQHIAVFLVDRQGNILWSERGAFAPEKLASLEEYIQMQHSGVSIPEF